MATELYRPCVAAIIQRADGRIFWGERIDNKGSWQFPQGGIEPGEIAHEACLREVEEEVGIPRHALRILAKREGYRYLYPKKVLKNGIYRGQEQTYVLLEFTGTDALINLEAEPREFRAFRWVLPDEINVKEVAKFKQDVYYAVMWDFFKVGKEPKAEKQA